MAWHGKIHQEYSKSSFFCFTSRVELETIHVYTAFIAELEITCILIILKDGGPLAHLNVRNIQ